MKSFTIGPNDSNQRVDKFISKAVPMLPQSLLYKSLRQKRIKRNGKRCERSDRLQEGDILQLYLKDEFFSSPSEKPAFLSAPFALSSSDILYEDANLLLIHKPVGLVVHEDSSQQPDTLIHRILRYLYEKGEYCPQEENAFAPALCNRIDRNTQGIVIAAKTAESLRILNQKIKDRELSKRYLCILHGHLEKKSAVLKAYLQKDSEQNLVRVTDQKTPSNLTILTKYRVLQESPRFTLAEVELLTGRTHQIRAHFAHIGHPLLGDAKYGLQRDNRGTGYRHQALCAYQLAFSFQTDSGILEYLRGKTFSVPLESIPFYQDFLMGKIR